MSVITRILCVSLILCVSYSTEVVGLVIAKNVWCPPRTKYTIKKSRVRDGGAAGFCGWHVCLRLADQASASEYHNAQGPINLGRVRCGSPCVQSCIARGPTLDRCSQHGLHLGTESVWFFFDFLCQNTSPCMVNAVARIYSTTWCVGVARQVLFLA